MRVALLLAATILAASPALAWQRTRCGPGDQVTEWGRAVDPNNVLPEYPRPQLVREDSSWKNLNGLWQFQPGQAGQSPPFGKILNDTILVPFPVESCLSGIGKTFKYLWYRLVFDRPTSFPAGNLVHLHFGAVDWQTTVYLNQQQVGNHTGGFDGFFVDLSSTIRATNNELIVAVFDPSDEGFQPNGKQRISAITNPGGDTYTPSSGIWQTVWLESVPQNHITRIKILPTLDRIYLTVYTSLGKVAVHAEASDSSEIVGRDGVSGVPFTLIMPKPRLWSPLDPFLYSLKISIASGDSVSSYFGLRTITLGSALNDDVLDTSAHDGIDNAGGDLPGQPTVMPRDDYRLCEALCQANSNCYAWSYGKPQSECHEQALCWLKGANYGAPGADACRVSGILRGNDPDPITRRPHLNGRPIFLAGWLDQSFWPDGLFTAPSDAALAFDIQSIKTFGFNTIRLHQKVNSERWYFHADRIGVVVQQDAVQKYGGATNATVAPFMHDLVAMVEGRFNHPCIIQWETFNEGDCWTVFNVSAVVQVVRKLDPSRLIDTNSGGGANDFHIADVNDIHDYPYPMDNKPSYTQYSMLGEFGGIGAYVAGKEWVPNQCQTYLHVDTPDDEANSYIGMIKSLINYRNDVSCSIYTQITDVERECDGFLNYDRTNKFSAQMTEAIANINQQLIGDQNV